MSLVKEAAIAPGRRRQPRKHRMRPRLAAARQKNEKIQSQKNIVRLRWASLELDYRTVAAGASNVQWLSKRDVFRRFRRSFPGNRPLKPSANPQC